MRILVVDDDDDMRTSLRRALTLDGYDTVLVGTAAEALTTLRDDPPDGVVLDWMLPDLDGVEVCRRLRAAEDDVPVLMLTARGAIADRIEGLEAGADDYLPKPFDVDELLARLKALLRRSRRAAAPAATSEPQQLRFDDLVLDLASRQARRGERIFQLSRTEFSLLELLMRHAGTVLGRERIMREVWDYDFRGSTGNLDVYVSYLRRKLEEGGESRLLHTVRGVGFVLRRGEPG